MVAPQASKPDTFRAKVNPLRLVSNPCFEAFYKRILLTMFCSPENGFVATVLDVVLVESITE